MTAKQMALRRADVCVECATSIDAGERAEWDSDRQVVTCLGCVDARTQPDRVAPDDYPDPEPLSQSKPVEFDPIDVGVAGASARKEHARRKAKREQQLEAKWGTGRIGRIAKALSDDPQTTRAWKEGAIGEERVAQILEKRLGETAVLLHDRKVPGTRGNIDHIVIAGSGIWVIDAKRYKGKVEKRDKGGWFATDLRLYVGGRDRTKLITSMGWQRVAVLTALGDPELDVHCALTFIGAEWPLLFRKPLQLEDVWISWPAKLAELISAPGSLDSAEIERTARLLAEKLPANR